MAYKLNIFKILTVVILLLPDSFSFGQVINNASHIHVKNGGLFYVSNDFNNQTTAAQDTASIIVEGVGSKFIINQNITNNAGVIHLIDGELNVSSYKSQMVGADSALVINQRGKVSVAQDWINLVGKYIDTVTSEFHFNGAANQMIAQNKDDLFWHVFFEGGGLKVLDGYLITNKAEFVGGVVLCDVADTFAIINIHDKNIGVVHPSDVIGGSDASHVEGPLWIKGQTKITFPIGSAGVFRPLSFTNIPDTVTVKAAVIQNIVPNPVLQLENVASKFAWEYTTLDSTEFLGSAATIIFPQSDTVGIGLSSNLVVAQGWKVSGDYVSLGNGGTLLNGSNIELTTNINPGQAQILAIGSECMSSKLSLLVKLEGAYRGGTYEANALNVSELNRFKFGGAGSINMLQGYSVPSAAVDVISIYVRESSSPYAYIDTTVAWALNDGSIQDFFTATESYVEFCDASIVETKPYMVEVRHRNHASVMTSTTAPYISNSNIPTSADEVDLTVASNLYGLSPAKLLGGEMYMYKGNTFSQNNNQEINSLDLIFMIQDVKTLLTGYLDTDVNLDGVVNTADYTDISSNALNLKVSSVP